MKKLFLVITLCLALAATASAQDHAIGIRFGGGSTNGGEISYQKPLGDANRLELDLGFIGNSEYGGVSLTGVYQWIWDLDDLGDGFGWYAGVGGGAQIFNGIGARICGQIGIEYTLPKIPIKFSLDSRPGLYIGNYNGFGADGALSIRYMF